MNSVTYTAVHMHNNSRNKNEFVDRQIVTWYGESGLARGQRVFWWVRYWLSPWWKNQFGRVSKSVGCDFLTACTKGLVFAGKLCFSADDCTDFEVVVDFYSSEDSVCDGRRWLINRRLLCGQLHLTLKALRIPTVQTTPFIITGDS